MYYLRYIRRFNRQRLEAMGLNARQIEIMILIVTQKRITNAGVQELTGANRKARSRDLEDLVERELIERHGQGRGTHYTARSD